MNMKPLTSEALGLRISRFPSGVIMGLVLSCIFSSGLSQNVHVSALSDAKALHSVHVFILVNVNYFKLPHWLAIASAMPW